MGNFAVALTMLQATKREFSRRPAVYNPLEEKFYELAFRVGESAIAACQTLGPTLPLWTCICARPYLEFAIRMLWASQNERGIERMFAYYAKQQDEWMEDIEEYLGPMPQADAAKLAELKKRLPPDPMPHGLPSVLCQIYARDKKDGTNSIFGSHTEEHASLVRLLHMFAHLNPHWLQHEPADHLDQSAHAVAWATTTLIRAVGYKLGWNQGAIIATVLRSMSYLNPELPHLQGIYAEAAKPTT